MKPVFTTGASFGFPPRRRDLPAALWKAAAAPDFASRPIYDRRIALCLQAFGVTDFATANVQHFEPERRFSAPKVRRQTSPGQRPGKA